MKTNNITPQVDGEFTKVLDEFYVYTGDSEDIYVQGSCRDSGIWDKDLTEWMMSNIQPGWKCLDIGSNIGYFTDIMARLSGPTGDVIAFEPIKHLYDSNLRSIEKNDYSNASKIIIHNTALSNNNGSSFIRIWHNNVGGSAVVDNQENGLHQDFGAYHTEEISISKLSDIYDNEVDFIKIDIEGHERFAIEGFGPNVNNFNLMVIELGYGQPEDFMRQLESKYDMSFVSGEVATIEAIKKFDVVNIVLRKK